MEIYIGDFAGLLKADTFCIFLTVNKSHEKVKNRSDWILLTCIAICTINLHGVQKLLKTY